MVLLTEEARQRRRRGYQRRGVVCALVFRLMILSVLAPTIGVRASDGITGRSMFPASRFFLFADVTSGGFGFDLGVPTAAAGVNPGVLRALVPARRSGLRLLHLLVAGAESVGRWTRRGLLLAGLAVRGERAGADDRLPAAFRAGAPLCWAGRGRSTWSPSSS